jgi:hypothetical protein
VGWSNIALPPCGDVTTCPMHAVLWTQTGVSRDFGTLPADTFSVAVKISLSGESQLGKNGRLPE